VNEVAGFPFIAEASTKCMVKLARQRTVVPVSRQNSQYMLDLLLFVFDFDECGCVQFVKL
jgi:hypothetical protein